MKYLSLFSGIGGFELGIQQAYELYNTEISRLEREQNPKNFYGVFPKHKSADGRQPPTCIGYSEIDKYAIEVYQSKFNHKNYGDITTINPTDLPEFDFICGGFPCQSFSIAGKRGGFNDTRGTLFFEIARIIKQKQPRLLLLENVKGLLSHDEGKTFRTIISTLDELGYDCQWQVLNSKNFGVPQNRERVFIVGHLRGTPRPKVFPIGISSQKSDGALGLQSSGQIAGALRATDYKGTHNNIRETIMFDDYNNKFRQDNVTGTLTPNTGSKTERNGQKVVIPVLTPDRLEKRQNGRRFKEDGEPSFTLTGQDKHGITDGVAIRRLTPLECERLQGFPDNWTKYGANNNDEKYYCANCNDLKGTCNCDEGYMKGVNRISDTQRYKMCGNAVTVNVIKEIMLKILWSSDKFLEF